HHLVMLGLPVSSATTPAEVVHKVRMTGKRDLVIAVSYGRGLRQTVEGLRQAQANGAYCVGITNTLISPLNQFANECFLTSVDTPSFGASYVAPMAFLNVIIAACANYRRSRTLTLLKLVEDEQKHGFRWYESSRMGMENLAPLAVGWVIRRYAPWCVMRGHSLTRRCGAAILFS